MSRKRGKNRPILGLIESNAADAVVSTTTKAFAEPDIRSSFSHLLALRGVGPATATYILAAFRPTEAPVFSDEAFRWIVHGGAWGTKIKYSAKEYWEYFEGVEQLAKQLGVGGEDIEKVGFVLGKEAVETAPVKGKTPARKEKESKIATGGIASNKRKAAVQHKQEDGADDDKKPRPGKKQKPLDPDTPKMAAPGRVLRSRTAAAKK